MDSLLPPNSTATERALEYAMGRIEDVPNPVATVRDPAQCPAPLLPWLAWAHSVDEWSEHWTEETKRQVIADSALQHSRRGTVGAIEDAVGIWSGAVSVRVWHESDPPGPPFTLSVTVAGGTAAGSNGDAVGKIDAAIRLNKSARDGYTLTVGAEYQSGIRAVNRARFATFLRGRA